MICISLIYHEMCYELILSGTSYLPIYLKKKKNYKHFDKNNIIIGIWP